MKNMNYDELFSYQHKNSELIIFNPSSKNFVIYTGTKSFAILELYYRDPNTKIPDILEFNISGEMIPVEKNIEKRIVFFDATIANWEINIEKEGMFKSDLDNYYLDIAIKDFPSGKYKTRHIFYEESDLISLKGIEFYKE